MAGPDEPEPMSFAMEGNEIEASTALPRGLPNARPWMAGQGYPKPGTPRHGWQRLRDRSWATRHCRAAAP
jgi:hypothetical protein